MMQHELSKRVLLTQNKQSACLVFFSRRHLFGIGKRILSNQKSNQVDPQTRYTNSTYAEAKKKFREETAHLMPGSDEYIKIRNRTYKELNKSQAKIDNQIKYKDMAHMQKDIQMDGDYINQLIVIPESLDCHEMIHIFNFNKFPFVVREDNYFKQTMKKNIGFRPEDQYPVLHMDSSSKEWPTHCVNDSQEILNYLTSMKLLLDPRDHSARESQGVQFVDDKLVPVFNNLFCTFISKLSFYMQGGRSFRQQQINTLKESYAWVYAWKMLKCVYLGYKDSREVKRQQRERFNREQQEKKQKIQEDELDNKLNKTENAGKDHDMITASNKGVAMLPRVLQSFHFRTGTLNHYFFMQNFKDLHKFCDEWVERCQIDNDSQNYFHGGSWPDRADFRMFALFYQYYHTNVIQKFLKGRGGQTEDDFCKWFERMKVITDYRQNIDEKQFGLY